MEDFLRHFKEGSKNLLRNKWLSVISLLSVMVTLFIVAIFTTIILNVSHITNNIEENIEAVVYLDIDVSKEEIKSIEKIIDKSKYTLSYKYISKEKGLEGLIKDLGEYGIAFENIKNDNPLNDTFVVKPKFPKDIEKLVKDLNNIKGIESIDYGKDITDSLLKVTNIIRLIGTLLIIGLVITALLLISNTIKNSIEVRREEIKIMRLVGASDNFIRAPYVIEGILIGLIGSLVPLIIVFVGYIYISDIYLSFVDISFMKILSLSELLPLVTLIVLGVSLLIGSFGSLLSIRKYLNK